MQIIRRQVVNTTVRSSHVVCISIVFRSKDRAQVMSVSAQTYIHSYGYVPSVGALQSTRRHALLTNNNRHRIPHSSSATRFAGYQRMDNIQPGMIHLKAQV